MSTAVVRTAEGRWVEQAGRLHRVRTSAETTAELLADRPAAAAATGAAAEEAGSPLVESELLPPVTAPCRVVAQMVNCRSHAKDSGFDPDRVPPASFRKASGSISGPYDEIVRPGHVRLLDYEAEIGLVLGAPLPIGAEVADADLGRYVAGLVVAQDVSARDVQLPKTQFYEAKSYPTFTPLSPRLLLVDAGEFAAFDRLRLTCRVNDVVRQDCTAADMITPPARALTLLARFQTMAPGDVLLTGTPGGTALKAPAKPLATLAALMPPERRWKACFAREAKNPRYLHDGDVVSTRIATDDGSLDLGTQRGTVVAK
jgi:2-keto-4-pentenoate hydratase/2-oxohepta-3-ene-1,7-dioic acid hydratase in catechol pathway